MSKKDAHGKASSSNKSNRSGQGYEEYTEKAKKWRPANSAAKTTTQIMKWIDLILCPVSSG